MSSEALQRSLDSQAGGDGEASPDGPVTVYESGRRTTAGRRGEAVEEGSLDGSGDSMAELFNDWGTRQAWETWDDEPVDRRETEDQDPSKSYSTKSSKSKSKDTVKKKSSDLLGYIMSQPLRDDLLIAFNEKDKKAAKEQEAREKVGPAARCCRCLATSSTCILTAHCLS